MRDLMKVVSVAVVVMSALALPACETMGDKEKWQPPTEGLVRDARAAITIARAVWISTTSANSRIANNVGSDDDWQSGMTATLREGVWEVATTSEPNSISVDLIICVAQRDARIVGIYVIQ
jgi:hypothetical protein